MGKTEKMGMMVDVFKDAHGTDCTNGGVTSKAKTALLIGEGVAKVFGTHEGTPVLRLARRGDYIYAEPVEKPEGALGPMMGGNFVYSSDSRFRAICPYPIPVHDRFETPEQYRALST